MEYVKTGEIITGAYGHRATKKDKIPENSVWYIDIPPLSTAFPSTSSKTATISSPPTSTVPKRGRGRPPKPGLPLPTAQGTAIDEVIESIESATAPRGRGTRQLSEMFMELPDRETWKEYYSVIPEPRCITGIKDNLSKSRYKNAVDVYHELRLVFLNALYYNEAESQIAKDAKTLMEKLETEWKKRPDLPPPPDPTPTPEPKEEEKEPETTSQSKDAFSSAPVPASSTSARVEFSKAILPEQPSARASPQPQTQDQTTRSSSTDMDVDVDIETPQQPSSSNLNDADPEPEYEIGSGGTAGGPDIGNATRDAEGDEIVKVLEKTLPRWDGFGERGWMTEVTQERYLEIVHAIKSHKDVIGNRVAASLDSIPEDSNIPNLSYNYPLSLKTIESRVRMGTYPSSKEFDMDFARLFEKGRRWYELGTDKYGEVLLLQRLYQALTSSDPPPGPPYTSTTNFAALRAGPGNARPLHSSSDADGVPGVTTFRVTTKDRQFVDQLDYKGWSVRLADWLHLANPDDPSRPIIAQIFKCWVNEEPSKRGQTGLTVCWYYRPEQTIHPAHRQFWEGEVFKTSHFADHPLDDIIEKIACQFTARHIRGRPRPPFYYPGWPLYVCDSRYNDRERVFVRIKNWNSCVPEEVRKSSEFMPIYPFERTVFPRRFGSPFLVKDRTSRSTAKLPGGIGESVERADGDKIEGGGTGRKRPRRNPGGPNARTDEVGPSKGLYVGPMTPTTGAQSIAASYGQQQPFRAQAQPPPALLQQQQQQPPQQPQIIARRPEDRTILGAAGPSAVIGKNAIIEKLPSETAKHFDRDPETNEVLWFAGPPVDIARPAPLRHSLDYLHFLARQRKKNKSHSMDVDVEASEKSSNKRPRTEKNNDVMQAPMSVILQSLWESTDQINPSSSGSQ